MQTGGILALSGDNRFEGGVTVQSGATLLLGSSSEVDCYGCILYGPVGTGTLKLESGSTLDLADSCSRILHNAIDLGCGDGSVAIDTGCGDLSLYGQITGNAGIIKKGGGTLSLQSNNEFYGNFKIEGGTVNAETDHALGYGSLEFCSAVCATVNFNSDHPTISGLSGTSCNDLINLNGDCSPAQLTIDQDGDSAFAGVIAGDGGSVIKTGCGDLTLSGQSTFTGGFTLQEGALLIGASSTIDCSGIITSGPAGTGTLKLETGTTLGVADSGSYTLHNAIDLGCFSGTVKIDTVCGDLTLVGVITGTAGITKAGPGTLTLEGHNQFYGDFKVQGGTVNAETDSALGYGTLAFCSYSVRR